MFEYRVVERKASMFGSRMKAADLEKVLNEQAGDGWELDRIIDNEGHKSMSIGKNVFYVVFRRPRQT